MSNKLDPCPSCHKMPTTYVSRIIFVRCDECNICGSSAHTHDYAIRNWQTAINAWNDFSVRTPTIEPEPPKSKTCGECGYCVEQIDIRDPWFECYAIPPTLEHTVSGRPSVKSEDIACSLFKVKSQ